MDVISLDNSNFTGLTAKYAPDATLKFNENVVFTEQFINVPVNDILKDICDNRINNYSNLILTRKDLITSAVHVETLDNLEDEGFSTYIAVNAAGSITPSTKFWVVQEPPINVSTALVRVSGEFSKVDNRYFFDVELLTDKFCKISHENSNITRYLTVDYTGNLSFTKDIQLDAIGALSPQVFYYVYDRAFNYLVLIKNINDIPKFITYNNTLGALTLVDPITGTSIPYSVSSVFRVRPRNMAPNETKLYDPWVSYNRNFKTNTQDINDDRSFNNINSNLILNNEYYTLSAGAIDFNILSLKNINTPENRTSRNNPFFTENAVEMRDYQSLFTGSNQYLGNDNISLGYESYVSNLVLKKDKITYFHIPQVFYPFERLNINDSGLIEAGAIAGDHPLKADKIFKKKGDYKYTSHFGDTAEENSGEFLCAWLSGNTDVNAKPIWVDRYYNPEKISYVQALTASDFKAIRYISIFDCLTDKALQAFKKEVDVFDKPSDLIFEKGTYYAYHHYGPKDVNAFIKTLADDLVNYNLPTYKYFNGTDVYTSTEGAEVFNFDGTKYGVTGSLSAIQDSNQFTLVFDGYSSDWTAPLGYQLVGNYDRDGFGMFNENVVTPFFLINSISGLYVTNTDFRILNQVALNANISKLIRLEGLNDFYGIFKDNTFRKYNLSYSEIRRAVAEDPNDLIGNIVGLDYTETDAYAIIENGPSDKKLMLMDLRNNTATDITTRLTLNPRVPNTTNMLLYTNLHFYNKKIYLTKGTKSERVDDNIFYLEDNRNIVKTDNLGTTNSTTTTAYNSNTKIEDFSFDFDNNIWMLFNDRSFAKFTLDRQFVLSGSFDQDNYTNLKVDFVADFNQGTYDRYALVTRQSYKGDRKNIQFVKVNLDGSIRSTELFKVYIPLGEVYTCNTNLNGNQLTYYVPGSNSYYPAALSAFSNGIAINQIITKQNYSTIASLCSTLIPYFNYIKNDGINITNSNYLRSFVEEKYPGSNLSVKAQLVNNFNINDNVTTEIILSLSALDPGYHNFAVRFDADNGYMFLFIDGQQRGVSAFKPRKYKFSNLLYRPFLVGSSSYAFSVPLFSYLKNTSYLADNFTVKNLYIYDKPLKDFDIMMHARKNMQIRDIVFDVACGQRNYVEEIERYFKLDTPASKSTLYNIIIRNSGISDEPLKYALEQRILSILKNTSPVYSKLNNIKWVN